MLDLILTSIIDGGRAQYNAYTFPEIEKKELHS